MKAIMNRGKVHYPNQKHHSTFKKVSEIDKEKISVTKDNRISLNGNLHHDTAQKMKFSIKDVFSKCDQIRRKLWIWSDLLKKSLMENLIFCPV